MPDGLLSVLADVGIVASVLWLLWFTRTLEHRIEDLEDHGKVTKL